MPGALLFNAGCNEQMSSPKPRKKNWHRSVSWFSRKMQKRTFNSEKWRHRSEG